MFSFTRILVPTDFSPPAQAALAYARQIAERFGASLHLLHVVDDRLGLGLTTEVYADAFPALIEGLQKEGRDQLEQAMPPADRPRSGCELVLLTGSPFSEIVQYAQDATIDLIVMGTHGRGGMAHMLLGSVAEKVVRRAPCPVLTVRNLPGGAAPAR